MIQGYGDLRFRITGHVHEGSVLVFPDRTLHWPVTDPAGVSMAALEAIVAEGAALEIVLIGCGPRFVPPPKGLAAGLRTAGLVLEWMGTGAACRTFNVLMTEARPAAAALIAVE